MGILKNILKKIEDVIYPINIYFFTIFVIFITFLIIFFPIAKNQNLKSIYSNENIQTLTTTNRLTTTNENFLSLSLLILYLMKIITPLKYFLKVILLKKFLKKLNFQKESIFLTIQN